MLPKEHTILNAPAWKATRSEHVTLGQNLEFGYRNFAFRFRYYLHLDDFIGAMRGLHPT